jgi:alpha,alpha-trehalase
MLIFKTSSVKFQSPDEIYGELFAQVQTTKVFPDDKTFTDCIPKTSIEEILTKYHTEKNVTGFDLKAFVYEYFTLPDLDHSQYTADTTVTITKHIDNLWEVLTRQASTQKTHSSLISLPYSYIVPGGRFREIFYWDSYFVMLGLQESNRYEQIENMINNFSFLIHTFGFIPNGNRTYFMTRSQPPFYALMIDILADKDPLIYIKYLPYLEKEYAFWMKGSEQLTAEGICSERVVRMPDGEILNRYWDEKTTPRPEGYSKELRSSKGMPADKAADMYREIRAACESGWDFSSRWLRDGQTFQSSYITEIIPVDLNCLLYHLEETISKAYKLKGDQEKESSYFSLAVKRKNAVLKYCWSNQDIFFMDYDFVQKTTTPCYSLAASFPLFFNIATVVQAKEVAKKIKTDFLQPGGFVTTLKTSPFQWDNPNGWAPLQWITVKGLLNYNEIELAISGARHWMQLNDKIYRTTGKLMEKYNVIDMNVHTGGGEYQLQDGFGWTNGTYLKLLSIL